MALKRRWSVGVAQLFCFPKVGATFCICIIENGADKNKMENISIFFLYIIAIISVNNMKYTIKLVSHHISSEKYVIHIFLMKFFSRKITASPRGHLKMDGIWTFRMQIKVVAGEKDSCVAKGTRIKWDRQIHTRVWLSTWNIGIVLKYEYIRSFHVLFHLLLHTIVRQNPKPAKSIQKKLSSFSHFCIQMRCFRVCRYNAKSAKKKGDSFFRT